MAGVLPFLPAIIGGAVDVAGMLFQKHEADNAVQRRVADMQKAGINPIAAAQVGGIGSAAVPSVPSFGADVQAGLNTALAYKRTQADVALTQARTANQNVQNDILNQVAVWTVAKAQADSQTASLVQRQLEIKLPLVLSQANAELKATLAGADRAAAAAELDRLLRTGYANTAEFEKYAGDGDHPWLNIIYQMMKAGIIPSAK